MLLAVELFFAAASAMLAAAALNGSVNAWRLQSHPIDFSMRILASIWMLFLVLATYQALAASGMTVLDGLPPSVISVAYECLLAILAFFLLTAAGAVRPWVLAVLGLRVTGGLIAALWLDRSAVVLPEVQWSLMALTLLAVVSVTGLVIRQVCYTHSRRSWLVLAACAMGLSMWLYQAALADGQLRALPVMYHLYAFFIFVLWKFVSLNADADKVLANAGKPFGSQSNFQTVASINSDDEFTSLALRGERQRISYELHDNVGSQIVSILFAMQAAEQPQKRFVMLSLEQCLSDLKMMVDALDSFDENVTEALGRLRYRVQHALDREGIKMRWDVDLSPELEAVHGIYAQQVLRIAQESMANVMRHAKASSVKVTCRFVPEFCHLMLEVFDNGVGIRRDDNNPVSGHGLEGMKRRAAAIGGMLHITSRSGSGTCVRLILPLPNLKPPQKEIVIQADMFAAPA